MDRKEEFHAAHMRAAASYALLSRAKRMSVGCVIVKNDSVIAYGYNGTPSGWDNDCETRNYNLSYDLNGNLFPGTEQHYPCVDENGKRYRLVTKPEVLHAEANAISKVARSTNSSCGATMYVTCSPCFECAKIIFQAGIVEVVYLHQYRCTKGLEFLLKSGVKVTHIGESALKFDNQSYRLVPPVA